MYKCPVHKLAPLAFGCSHVTQALEAGSPSTKRATRRWSALIAWQGWPARWNSSRGLTPCRRSDSWLRWIALSASRSANAPTPCPTCSRW